ncbi:N-acetylmuramoyl-L-alanine amidase [Aeromonas sp. BIGb0405]|uniref:N-acetylmuramoyl-L-alanine amidase n=1 Tax=Aeromonas sp. BIGb0405 TaxID=2940592 RepID=UPI00286E2BB6|nr:N-acetylmuramoyl-L-alanine amidase [Aeromonas sp. BIGb0405]MCS3457227.1 N-acetylmuramoyl-L-alanine amidase [Aeromonas sp. BIGb0405]
MAAPSLPHQIRSLGWSAAQLSPLVLCCSLLLVLLVLQGCKPVHYRLEHQYQSASQDGRIAFLILHYTDEDDDHSLRLLTQSPYKVSAHYLVPRAPDRSPLPIYQLVPDSQRAWHAGRSRWHNQAGLNASSLGIEIVNLGYDTKEAQLPIDARHWQTFTEAQIAAVGALSQDLVERYHIPPTHVLAHSDIAPTRKLDPGPRFPWRRLSLEYGVGAWPDEARVAVLNAELEQAPQGRWDAARWQQALARYGYDLPQSGDWDAPSRDALRAFQLHFRAARVDSEPDNESQAILMALLEKYHPAHP